VQATPAVRADSFRTVARRGFELASPKTGPERYSGFSRAKLYELAGKGAIRSVSIREPGQTKGTRLFNLASILTFIEKCEQNAADEAAKATTGETVNA